MGFFKNRIGESDPYSSYQVEGIEKDKKGREPFTELPLKLPEKKTFFLISILRYLYKKILRILSFGSGKTCENLYSIRRVFQIMQLEDRSQDAELLQNFSHLWEKIHDDLLLFRKNSKQYSLFNQWIAKIDSYPEGQQFSLGYYLSHRAGIKWLPFPYMEIIQNLHIEHQKNLRESTLSGWIESLDQLIDLLQPE